MRVIIAVLCLCTASATAGTVLWDGFFNASSKISDFDAWSFSNKTGKWQWYIHGSEPTATYLNLSFCYKNPADTTSAQGIRTTIDGTSFWHNQTMQRTEIIPQTSVNLGTGHLYYHFSLMTSTINAPDPGFEHQIAFFENHFTELKFGLVSGDADPLLRWDVSGVSQWSTTLKASNWYNFAYDIDFSTGTVGLWSSNGSEPLTQIVTPMSATTFTDSADWHIGVLRLPKDGTIPATPEDWYWSGIYVEQAPITTSIAGPSSDVTSARPDVGGYSG
ncbi:hypothetical protein BU17DRAFT_77622 [Hysterangium stoloniferum]|nr:hypothetical protein BU17DRAFT_77622 [Hysterangium stoloniferum]